MNITTTDLQLFQILRQKIGEQEAEALVGFVDSKLRENNEANSKILETKEEIARLKGELETRIAEAKSDTTKCMFIFWTGSILTALGRMFAFLQSIPKQMIKVGYKNCDKRQ